MEKWWWQEGNQEGVLSWKPGEEGIQERSSVACWVRAAQDEEEEMLDVAKVAAGFGGGRPLLSLVRSGSVLPGVNNHGKLWASFADMVE